MADSGTPGTAGSSVDENPLHCSTCACTSTTLQKKGRRQFLTTQVVYRAALALHYRRHVCNPVVERAVLTSISPGAVQIPSSDCCHIVQEHDAPHKHQLWIQCSPMPSAKSTICSISQQQCHKHASKCLANNFIPVMQHAITCGAGNLESIPLLLASAELPEQLWHPAALSIPCLDLNHLHIPSAQLQLLGTVCAAIHGMLKPATAPFMHVVNTCR